MKKINLFFAGALFFAGSIHAQTISDGLKALDNDRYSEAKTIFKSLLTNPETGPEAYFQLANCYFEADQNDSAAIIINRMTKAFPSNAFTKIASGKLALNKKNAAEAKADFEEAIKMTTGKDVKIMQWIGYSYLTADKPDGPGALAVLNQAVKLDPKNAELYILIGDAYKLDQSAGGQAVTNYEKVLDMNMMQAKANQRIGVIYMQARNFETSSASFEKSLAADPHYAPAYRDYAMLNYNFRRYEKARELYEKYLSIADTTVNSMTRYVYILFQVKDYAKSTEVISRLLKMDSSNCLLNRLLGYSYSEQKEDSTGLIYMNKFLACADTSKLIPLDYKYLGHMLVKTNQDSLGIETLKKAIAFDSSDVDMWQEYADALYKLRRYVEAGEIYKRKIDQSKTPSTLDYYNVGRSYWFSKDSILFPAADSAFAMVIERKPDNPIGYLWRGKIASKMYSSELDSAFPFYSKYIDLSTAGDTTKPKTRQDKLDLLESYDFMAVYYIKKDEKSTAKKYLNLIVLLDDDATLGYRKRAEDLLSRLK